MYFKKRLKVKLLSMIQIVHTQKSFKIIFLAVLLIKLFVLTTNLVKKLFCTEERMMLNLLNQFLISTIIAEK